MVIIFPGKPIYEAAQGNNRCVATGYHREKMGCFLSMRSLFETASKKLGAGEKEPFCTYDNSVTTSLMFTKNRFGPYRQL